MKKLYTLYHGDCLEVMKSIPDNSVDMILCDPPYGIVKKLSIKTSSFNADWDTRLDTKTLFAHYERLLRPSGVCVIFSQEPYTNHLRGFNYNNLPFLYPLYWKKNMFCNPFGAKVAPKSFIEDISVFRKKYDSGNINPLREYFKGILDKLNITSKDVERRLGHGKLIHAFRHDTIQFSIPTKSSYEELISAFEIDKLDGFIPYEELIIINERYSPTFNLFDNKKFHSNFLEFSKKRCKDLHPTAKPVALLEHLIKIYSNKGDTILDNCMGSGSTGVASLNVGRKFIGIEKEEKFFKISKKRLDNILPL